MLLYVEHHGKQEVVMGCGYAASRGVRPGMTVAQAAALLDRPAVLREHGPAADAAALQALGRWCLRFTPRVAVEARAGLVMEMTGCERLYGGPHRMVEAVVKPLRAMGLTVRAALAPTRAGAWALAWADRSAVCVVRTLEELYVRLDDLPHGALGLEPGEVDGLSEVGIDRVEQLRAVAREEVVARFGAGVLRKLDRARGDAACEDIEPIRRWEPPAATVRFEGPTTRVEAVERAVHGLCDELAERLRERLRAAGTLTLEVERLDRDLRVEVVRETVTLSRPSRDAKHLWSMLRPHVERLHLGRGVEAFKLTAKQAPRVGLTQMGRSTAAVHGAELAAAEAVLVDVLSARLGAGVVVRPVAVETHVPEAALRWVRGVERHEGTKARIKRKARRHAGTKARRDRVSERHGGIEAHKHEEEQRLNGREPQADRSSGSPLSLPQPSAFHFVPWCPRACVPLPSPPRPTWLLDPIEPAEVVLLNPEGPVLSLQWRGTSRRLLDSIGPERIAARWWRRAGTKARRHEGTEWGEGTEARSHEGTEGRAEKSGAGGFEVAQADPSDSSLRASVPDAFVPSAAARDYYRVQDEHGLWLWVFRRLDTGRWFVHGVWV